MAIMRRDGRFIPKADIASPFMSTRPSSFSPGVEAADLSRQAAGAP
jgi:hypothetical protein